MALMSRDLPSGTVTFLFTDVEGSTRLLGELGADGYRKLLAEHREVIRDTCARFEGVEVDTQGDAFFFAFPTAPGAIAAAQAITENLAPGSIHVRIGLHTGTPLLSDGAYVGTDVHRAARIAAAGHGGQVLVSASTAALVDVPLRNLGEHRFKDLTAPEQVFQLGADEHPPLRTVRNVRLPVPMTPFVGRKRELASVVELLLLRESRLVTLTGPGGTGKTRLALQAATEAADRYPDGICWVPLAPLRDPALLLSAVAHALELKEAPGRQLREALVAELVEKQALLLLDNAEHLLPHAAHEIAELAGATGGMILVTSRERLQVNGEQVFPVPTLTEEDGVALFLARARALEPTFKTSESIRELCSRLDHLPLALELAAARTTLFSPEQLLERLSWDLDLLSGGRDADPRQQTLRATIEWSHALLSAQEQRLFRAISVFAGGCSYEAAEEVCGADPDTLQSLLDKSLLRRRNSAFHSRYWMLETIREYATERLEADGEAIVMRRRQAEWSCVFAEQVIGPPEKTSGFVRVTEDALQRLDDERDNLAAALAWAWTNANDELALRLGTACARFWIERGLFADAIAWLEAATPKIPSGSPTVQLQALKAAGRIAFFVLADAEQADDFWAQAQAVAEDLGEPDEIAWIEMRRAGVEWERGNLDLALETYGHSLNRARVAGDPERQADCLHLLGEVLRDLGRFNEAERALVEADQIARELGNRELFVASNTHSLGDLALDRGDHGTAFRLYRRGIGELRGRSPTIELFCLAGIASVLAERNRDAEAATLWGAVCALEEALGFHMLAGERRRYERRLSKFEGTSAWIEGRSLSLDAALASIRSDED